MCENGIQGIGDLKWVAEVDQHLKHTFILFAFFDGAGRFFSLCAICVCTRSMRFI